MIIHKGDTVVVQRHSARPWTGIATETFDTTTRTFAPLELLQPEAIISLGGTRWEKGEKPPVRLPFCKLEVIKNV